MAPILSELSLSTAVEFEDISHAAKDIYAIATITAPDVEVDRAPIDITCVIDRSGSMGGDKIALVRETLSFVVDQLMESDRLSLVIFDHAIETVLQLTNMTKSNKVEAKNIIKGITARGSTNLSDALYTGLQISSNRTSPNDICSVLLFTDGLANSGINAADNVVAGMDVHMKSMKKPVNVFTFGFGNDHDANMLRAVAEAGTGLYYYIQKNDEIPQSFSDCLGGLLSVSAQNIKLKIDPIDGCTLKAVRTDYKKPSENEIIIGDLYAGETKDIVFEVGVGEIGEDNQSQQLVKLSIAYYNVVEKTHGEQSITTTVRRLKDAKMDVPNKDVDKQRMRISQADALRQGRLLADQGDLQALRSVVQQQQKVLKTSAYAQDDFYCGLNDALDDVLQNTESIQAYQSRGNKVINKQWSEQSNQRSNAIKSTYATKSKSKMLSA
ncbi:secreted protein with Ig-like and vWFA domains, partial [Acrasis kona]